MVRAFGQVAAQADSAAQSGAAGIVDSVRSGLLDALSVPLFSIGDHAVSAWSIIMALLVVLLGWVVSKIVQRGLIGLFRRQKVTDEGVIGTARRLMHYAIMVAAIFVALALVGIDISGLFAAGALAAVAVGFALQQVLQNFVSGVLLLTERSITPSDILEVDGRMVQVVDMRIRSTVARTRDEEELIIPNSTLVQSSVKNFTLRDSLLRLRTQVGVAYESDVDRVFEVLREAASLIDEREHEIEPAVLFVEFGNSALIFDVSIWVSDPWGTQTTRSRLNHRIWRALKDAGITVAFPQMDVHLDGALRVVDPGGASRSSGGGPSQA